MNKTTPTDFMCASKMLGGPHICSADGSQLAGASFLRGGFGAGILTSVDAGATWIFSSAPQRGMVSNSAVRDGNNLVAADGTADAIYTSSDAGNTWTQHSPPLQAFASVASSADGSKLVAASENNSSGKGGIFVSTNSGLNWTQTTAPITNWTTVACSSDAKTIIAAGGGQTSVGHLFLSTDAGATWKQTNILFTHWSSVAVSADGDKMIAADSNGHIYTLDLTPFTLSPAISLKVTASNAIISWLVPSTNFILQQNTSLTAPSWTDVTTPPSERRPFLRLA